MKRFILTAITVLFALAFISHAGSPGILETNNDYIEQLIIKGETGGDANGDDGPRHEVPITGEHNNSVINVQFTENIGRVEISITGGNTSFYQGNHNSVLRSGVMISINELPAGTYRVKFSSTLAGSYYADFVKR